MTPTRRTSQTSTTSSGSSTLPGRRESTSSPDLSGTNSAWKQPSIGRRFDEKSPVDNLSRSRRRQFVQKLSQTICLEGSPDVAKDVDELTQPAEQISGLVLLTRRGLRVVTVIDSDPITKTDEDAR